MDAQTIQLNSEQLEAVRFSQGPLLIIAGAGTGKTTVITERIKWLITQKKVLPSEILALTFTDKAAREMEARVDIAMPYGYTQMWISTFHAFCDRVLRLDAIHIGLDPAYRLMTEAETILFLRKHLFAFDLHYFRPLGNPTKFLEGMLAHLSRLKDEDISVGDYLSYAGNVENDDEGEKTKELASAYKTYEALKAKEGVMDFGDLITNTLRLFRTRKNILSQYQEKFKYILVDEFQDTNFAQNELAKLLVGKDQNITVVGDDDQAIYRWRGAAISNIIQFRKHFPKTKVVTLTKNYRSTSEILDKAYTLIQFNNPDRLEAKEHIDKKLTSVRKVKGEDVSFLRCDRVENEADKVVDEILELVKKYQYKDMAILVRANDHAEPFMRALSRHNIPFQFLGPGQLFQQNEIKNLISYLKVLYNFEDNVSLYRVLSQDMFQITARDLAAILNVARRSNLSLFETLEKIDEVFLQDDVKEKVKKITAMISRHLKKIANETAGQILYYFMQDSGLLKKMIDVKSTKDEKTSQNIAKFFDKLKTYEAEHEDASVNAVVDWIDLSMQMGESPQATNVDWTEVDAVNILTVHSSKGLEFPIVFLVNLVEGRFPTRERRERIPIPDSLVKEILPVGDYHLEEERRLFYVGMTRARDYLFLTASDFYGEGKRERKISPFVSETLGRKVIEQSLVAKTKPKVSQLPLLDWSPKIEIAESDKPRTKMQIDYLSYSQIETFNVCPMHYKAKYILRLPTPQSSAQSFGTSIHATLRDFYQEILQKRKVSKETLGTFLDKHWINEGYHSKEHEQMALKRGKKMLASFFENFYDPKVIPVGLELPFKFRIQDLQIGGKIDRIDRNGNGIEITDYKTGANMPDEKELTSNLQLTIYALAATEVHDALLGKKPEEVTLSFYFLDDGVKLTTKRTTEQLAKAKELLLAKAKAIAGSDFLCNHGMFCGNCEYKMLCG